MFETLPNKQNNQTLQQDSACFKKDQTISPPSFSFLFLFISPNLIMLFELGKERLTTDAIDELSLYRWEIIKGLRVEDVFVAGWRSNLPQLLKVCISNSNGQDTDTLKKREIWLLKDKTFPD